MSQFLRQHGSRGLINGHIDDALPANDRRRRVRQLRVTIASVRSSKVAQRSAVQRARTSPPVLRHRAKPLRQINVSWNQSDIAASGALGALYGMPSRIRRRDPAINTSTSTALGAGGHVDPTQLLSLMTGKSKVEKRCLFASQTEFPTQQRDRRDVLLALGAQFLNDGLQLRTIQADGCIGANARPLTDVVARPDPQGPIAAQRFEHDVDRA